MKSSEKNERELLLCMTPGVGLVDWHKAGMLGRELRLYAYYHAQGWKVTILSFGSGSVPQRITETFNVVSLQRRFHLLFAPLMLWRVIRRADVLKTNQAWGGWVYVFLAKLFRKPLLLRCGWVPGRAIESFSGAVSLKLRVVRMLEGWMFRNATHSEVATTTDREWICDQYGVDRHRVSVLPNYVDTEIFKPNSRLTASARSVVYVGRFSTEKRVDLLLEACAAAKTERITLVGSGKEHDRLRSIAQRLTLKVNFAGIIENEELPKVVTNHQIFLMTSISEGHPKALFEAMACGLACVGTKVHGISDAISHEVTGILCDPSVDSIRKALQRLFHDHVLREELGSNARAYVQKHLSIDTIAEREITLVNKIVS